MACGFYVKKKKQAKRSRTLMKN